MSMSSNVAFAAEASKVNPAPNVQPIVETKVRAETKKVSEPESLETATEKFRSILENAKLNGFVSSKSEEESVAPTDNNSDLMRAARRLSEDAAKAEPVQVDKAAAFTCADMTVLNMSKFVDVQTFEDLIAEKSKADGKIDAKEVESLALTYISLGLGAEAKALLRPFNSPRHKVLSHASDLLSGVSLSPEQFMFSETATCDGVSDLWADLENPDRLESAAFISGPQTVKKELSNYPTFLKLHLGVELAISAADRGNMRLAKALWADIIQSNPALRVDVGGDHALLYLSAKLETADKPKKAEAIFKYLSERDGLYRVRSLQALTHMTYASGSILSPEMETDLVSINHELSGEKAGRDAAVQLIKNRIESGMAIDAMRSTRKMLKPEDEEFLYAVDLIAVHIQGLFDSPQSTVKMLGLNSYLEDPDIFDISNHQASLQRAALLAAITLDLPELGDVIYGSAKTVADSDKAFIAYAKALSDLKQDKFPEASMDLTADVTNAAKENAHTNTLRTKVIQTAMRLGDFKTARLTIATLPDGQEKSDYTTQLAWLEREWETVQTDLSKSPQDTTVSKARRDMVDFITEETPNTKTAPRLRNPVDVAAFVSNLDSDLSTVKEYLDNG